MTERTENRVPRRRVGNFIYIPVLAAGTASIGLILSDALERKESSPSSASIVTPIVREVGNCSTRKAQVSDTVYIGRPDYQHAFSNVQRNFEILSSNPGLKIDLENGIPSVWSEYEPREDWYAKLKLFYQDGTSELKVAVNYGKFDKELTPTECEEAQRQLKQAISTYQTLAR